MDMIYAADFSLATLLSSMSWTFNSNNFLWLGNALTLVHSSDDPTNPTDNVLRVHAPSSQICTETNKRNTC